MLEMMMDSFRIRKLMTWVFLGLLLMGLSYQARRVAEIIPFDDFLVYWSAARLQLTGQNPYSLEQLQSLQRAVGFKAESSIHGVVPTLGVSTNPSVWVP